MSDDLISKVEVIKIIDELGYVNCHNGKDFEANNRVDKIRQKIIEMPTAYDADEVIGQLKERLCSKEDEKTDFDCFMRNKHFREAVKIVKLGGRK